MGDSIHTGSIQAFRCSGRMHTVRGRARGHRVLTVTWRVIGAAVMADLAMPHVLDGFEMPNGAGWQPILIDTCQVIG